MLSQKMAAPSAAFVLASVWMGHAWFAPAQQPRRIDDAALRNAGKSGEEWIMYGLNYNENRYSPLNLINTSNVSRLGLAWVYEAGPGGGGQEATPLFYNGTIYGITNWSIVFALDARTGKEKWRWDPEINQAAVRPKICCGVVNRGLALYGNSVIAPINDGRLVALNMETGKPVWEARVEYPQNNYTITIAPRVARGKVFIGVSGSEYPVRGFFDAYDANDGHRVWRFYTVPGDPSKPFENEAMRKASATWSKDAWKMGGGGTVWDGMAYDPETNTLFAGTGNAGPWPEELRKQGKEMDNLYVCSIIAVDADTGAYKWHFQMVPGDEWDFDSVQQILLADLTIRGQRRKVLMQANKNGFYYVLDRTNGKFISATPFAEITWAKGLNEETGRPIVNQESYYGKESITLAPGPGGAHNWSPMSYNPSTGLVYVPVSSQGGFAFAVDENFEYKPGQWNMGIKFGPPPPPPAPGQAGATENGAAPEVANAAAARGAAGPSTPAAEPPKRLPSPPSIGPKAPQGERGALVAVDPVSGQIRWRASGGGGIGGGTVTTAGNLVFQVVPDGRLLAYSADKGEKLFEVQTGLRSGMAPPITYEMDGKQYITFMGGQGRVPPPNFGNNAGGRGGRGGAAAAGGGNNTPPPPLAESSNVVTPKVLTFVLDGKGTLPVVQKQP